METGLNAQSSHITINTPTFSQALPGLFLADIQRHSPPLPGPRRVRVTEFGMAITQQQQSIIVKAHAKGHLDPAIANLAGVSIATVKRYRTKLGLKTNCVTAQRGELGEQLTFNEAGRRGLKAEWRKGHNDEFDLYVEGQRVDAKASMQLADGSWRFRLPTKRPSFYGQFEYRKDYAADCDVVALVALYPDGREPDFYLLSSKSLPTDIRIRPGCVYDAFRNDWGLLEEEAPALVA